jgi:hypothetical protein
MTAKQIINKLKDTRLDTISRELLLQQLHHLQQNKKKP